MTTRRHRGLRGTLRRLTSQTHLMGEVLHGDAAEVTATCRQPANGSQARNRLPGYSRLACAYS